LGRRVGHAAPFTVAAVVLTRASDFGPQTSAACEEVRVKLIDWHELLSLPVDGVERPRRELVVEWDGQGLRSAVGSRPAKLGVTAANVYDFEAERTQRTEDVATAQPLQPR
jgi:hypothetical protein